MESGGAEKFSSEGYLEVDQGARTSSEDDNGNGETLHASPQHDVQYAYKSGPAVYNQSVEGISTCPGSRNVSQPNQYLGVPSEPANVLLNITSLNFSAFHPPQATSCETRARPEATNGGIRNPYPGHVPVSLHQQAGASSNASISNFSQRAVYGSDPSCENPRTNPHATLQSERIAALYTSAMGQGHGGPRSLVHAIVGLNPAAQNYSNACAVRSCHLPARQRFPGNVPGQALPIRFIQPVWQVRSSALASTMATYASAFSNESRQQTPTSACVQQWLKAAHRFLEHTAYERFGMSANTFAQLKHFLEYLRGFHTAVWSGAVMQSIGINQELNSALQRMQDSWKKAQGLNRQAELLVQALDEWIANNRPPMSGAIYVARYLYPFRQSSDGLYEANASHFERTGVVDRVWILAMRRLKHLKTLYSMATASSPASAPTSWDSANGMEPTATLNVTHAVASNQSANAAFQNVGAGVMHNMAGPNNRASFLMHEQETVAAARNRSSPEIMRSSTPKREAEDALYAVKLSPYQQLNAPTQRQLSFRHAVAPEGYQHSAATRSRAPCVTQAACRPPPRPVAVPNNDEYDVLSQIRYHVLQRIPESELFKVQGTETQEPRVEHQPLPTQPTAPSSTKTDISGNEGSQQLPSCSRDDENDSLTLDDDLLDWINETAFPSERNDPGTHAPSSGNVDPVKQAKQEEVIDTLNTSLNREEMINFAADIPDLI